MSNEINLFMNIKQKIELYDSLFESKTREDGTHYVVIPSENEPNYNEDLYNAVRAAHGDRLPDDWVYGTFADLMQKLTEYEINSIDNVEEYRNEIVDSYVDVYTADLTKWLASDINNVYYITEVLEEWETKDGFQLLAQAQYKAIDEVMTEVINLLSK